jgi:hypothetical protein
MYMKNVMYKIIMGCYIVAALVLVTACNDNLDIQQAYPFSILDTVSMGTPFDSVVVVANVCLLYPILFLPCRFVIRGLLFPFLLRCCHY